MGTGGAFWRISGVVRGAVAEHTERKLTGDTAKEVSEEGQTI